MSGLIENVFLLYVNYITNKIEWKADFIKT